MDSHSVICRFGTRARVRHGLCRGARPALLVALLLAAPHISPPAAAGLPETIAHVQAAAVKIHGAGGFQSLEAYQSGIVISENGHVLTAWSYVLDSDRVTVTLSDGRHFDAELLGADPTLEVAVLKIDETGLPHFRLDEAAAAKLGDRILAVANLFGVAAGNEPLSVLHGWVAAIGPLEARRGRNHRGRNHRGRSDVPYRGDVYYLDAISNNPGAAGGAVVDFQGRLIGVIGKELRDARAEIWINYALPIAEVSAAVDAILDGRRRPVQTTDLPRPADPWTFRQLGLLLVPDLLPKTPAFVEQVRPASAADRAGLRPDDLIVMAEGRLVTNCQQLRELVASVERTEPLHLSVVREQTVLELTLAGQEVQP